jgi:hypothetical protein
MQTEEEEEEMNDRIIQEVKSVLIWSQKKHMKQSSSILTKWRYLHYKMLNNHHQY